MLDRWRAWHLERQIAQAIRALVAADSQPARRAAFERARALIRRRSPQQVARMERRLRLAV